MKTENQLQEPPVAQFHRHVIGEVELIALSDGGLNYPAAMIFGNVPPEGARVTTCQGVNCSSRTLCFSSEVDAA